MVDRSQCFFFGTRTKERMFKSLLSVKKVIKLFRLYL